MLVFKCYDCGTKIIPGPSVSVIGSNCQMCGGRVETWDEVPPAPTPDDYRNRSHTISMETREDGTVSVVIE